jgi:hypothetical protein
VRWQKTALLVLRRVGLCVGQNQMCRLCGWLKEILKNAKGQLFLFLLSPVCIVKHGQLVCLSAWSIWSVCRVHFQSLSCCVVCLFSIGGNVLQLPEGGDFEALHCQPSRNFDRSTKLDLTTEPPLLGRCCYAVGFLSRCSLSLSFIIFSKSLKLYFKVFEVIDNGVPYILLFPSISFLLKPFTLSR